jgi:hypothetical protein
VPQLCPSFPSDHHVHRIANAFEAMNRDDKLDALVSVLELLIPFAQAVPTLGSSIEGALQAAIKVITLAQVRTM